MKFTIKNNEVWKNSNEIYFDEKPSSATISKLKNLKMRWNPNKKCWYGFVTEKEINAALNTIKEKSNSNNSFDDFNILNEGTRYEGWQGSNNTKWANYEELKQLLQKDFKKYGIKASIKKNKAGYLTSITIRMSVSSTEILTAEEYIQENTKNFYSCFAKGQYWFDYKDEKGNIKTIHFNELFDLEPSKEETQELIKNIVTTKYYRSLNIATSDILKPDALERYNLLKKIVKSYNSDCSDLMTDYFDRDIYDHYEIKIVA